MEMVWTSKQKSGWPVHAKGSLKRKKDPPSPQPTTVKKQGGGQQGRSVAPLPQTGYGDGHLQSSHLVP